MTIIAVGLTVSLAVGGFDLSVGSTASGERAGHFHVRLARAKYRHRHRPHALFCLAVGLINAFLVINFKIDDMLMTLATMFIFQGIALTYTRALPFPRI